MLDRMIQDMERNYFERNRYSKENILKVFSKIEKLEKRCF